MSMMAFLVSLAALCVVGSLVLGVAAMANHGEIAHRTSAQWMSLRVGSGLALAPIVAALLMGRGLVPVERRRTSDGQPGPTVDSVRTWPASVSGGLSGLRPWLRHCRTVAPDILNNARLLNAIL
jgi:hypothetical protein